MITILLQKILTSLTSLLTGLVTSLTAIDEALDVPVIVKTVTGAVCNFTANIARRCYSVKTTITASGGGGTPSDPVAIVGTDTLMLYQAGSDISHPFISEIEFDDTCYGGVYDASTGILTKTYNSITDWSSTTVSNNQTGDNTYEAVINITDKKNGTTNLKCNKLPNAGWSDDGNYGIRGYISSTTIAMRFPISVCSSPADVKQWLIDNEVQLIYELNEPVEINIGSVNVTPEIGENNIWYDSGNDTTVIYYEKLEA